MTRSRMTTFATALVGVAVAATAAQAGPYPTNTCVAKKQGALGKHAAAVAKALSGELKTAEDPATDIAASQTKLDATWSKSEATAVKKSSSCDEATGTSAAVGGAVTSGVEAAVTALTQGLNLDDKAVSTCAQKQIGAIGKYLSSAAKAHSKYIKAPSAEAKTTRDTTLSTLSNDLDTTLGDIVAASGAACAAGNPAGVDEALENTLDAIVEQTTTAPNYPSAATMVTAEDRVQYLGKELAPSCVNGTDYSFFTRRGTEGDHNKILYYFQGGGACWSGLTCGVPTCKTETGPGDNPELVGTGFADLDNPNNPFSTWTVVFVGYCSCDVHWGGGLSTSYTSEGGGTYRHRGRTNAAVVEKWAREHFLDPEAVFVTGSSAGSYGALMNSYYLIRDVWPNADFSVLGDGGIGVITKDFLNSYLENSWKVESVLPTDIPGVEPPVTSLSIVELTEGLADRFPNARWAHYDSSYDGGGGSQCNFFQIMRNPDDVVGEGLNWWEPSCEWNACMREFKAEIASNSPNYRYFTGAGSRHTVFGSDKIYTDMRSTTADGTPQTVLDFVNAMIGDLPTWENVDCNNPGGGDCNLVNTCQGGTNAGGDCTSDAQCPGGGDCEHDPDTPNDPYNNDDTVTCAPTTCPCDEVNCSSD